jgi:hypothetical protein
MAEIKIVDETLFDNRSESLKTVEDTRTQNMVAED